MKYKHIDSALHNFGHSFVSLMNYVDDVYVCDLISSMALGRPQNEVKIDFSAGVSSLPHGSPAPLIKSVEYWQAWLPKLLESQNVNPGSLGPIVLRYRLTRLGPEVVVESTDDRGCAHKVFVSSTL
ncbi:hypothetical protein HNP55_002244 [Paucibacter oligotrophus]|uniref:Uncharacterized protein n=1 Tax=Roseateles oligotrophus TaxID=1769250 RepID=A0A840L7H5_9BURK|nr:hypothetical protein [Roseateles oligotrophus]MBB4843721.1 hypothetical protein [Roseateles oligotrophus]